MKRRALPAKSTALIIKKAAQGVVNYSLGPYRRIRKNRSEIIADMARIHRVPQARIKEELAKMGK